MVLNIRADQLVQVGGQLVDDSQAQRTYEDTGNGVEQPPFSAILDGGQDEAQHRRRQHHARSEGQHDIGELVGKIAEDEAKQSTDEGRSANAKGCE